MIHIFLHPGSSVSLTAIKRNCIPLIHNHTYSAEDCHDAGETENPFAGHAVHSLYLGSDDVIQNGDICVCHSELCNQAAPPTSGSWLAACFSMLIMHKFTWKSEHVNRMEFSRCSGKIYWKGIRVLYKRDNVGCGHHGLFEYNFHRFCQNVVCI